MPAIDAPLEIATYDGEVVFIGPGAVAFAMTRSAAQQTLERLREVLSVAKEP